MQFLEDKIHHQIHNLSSLKNSYDAFLFDVWGVLHEGGDIYENVQLLFNEIAKDKIARIISNAPRRADTISKNLTNHGLNLTHEMVFTSGEVARKYLNNSEKYLSLKSPVVYHIGGNRNNELIEANVQETNDLRRANIILLSAYRDHDEDYADIVHDLELAVAYNKPVLCANPDTLVLHLGQVRKCAGYFANLFHKLGGKVIYTGKPEKIIFEECLNSFDSQGKRILMIGDTFATDIHGANSMGIDSALVLTGNMGLLMKEIESTGLDAANQICSKQRHTPTYLVNME